ncbi:peptidase inhibitor family I36 protein [Streptomyces sp. NBC_01317]|uniref:peptidase inhibitor family I36 protein n=1 Tax=Streptomyces sp. NBC_01317 TaxID=2903822 RepID=UPI002E15B1EE|nr:peptidase inhibitor family I36 protein [Streptomyces sp. NBC_01317]
MRIRQVLSAAALSVAMAATFVIGSSGTASAAPADCKSGWVCLWDFPGYEGAAWSAASGPGFYSVGSNVQGKVSSVWNNSGYSVNLYSECDGWIVLPAGSYISDLSTWNCAGTTFNTWNNRTDSLDVY